MTTSSIDMVPKWDMTTFYPALDSPEFQADFDRLVAQIAELATFMEGPLQAANPDDPAAQAQVAGELLDRINQAILLNSTLQAYIKGFTDVDSFNNEARRLESQWETHSARLDELVSVFRRWAGQVAGQLPEMLPLNPTLQAHRFALEEAASRAKYLLSPAEESLVAELILSGSKAWEKLQANVTSQLTVEFELDGQRQTLSMPALINLRSHPDESVRRRGYETELETWKQVREPLTAAMNGIKGEVVTLNRRRGRPDALHASLEAARIDRETLDAMLGAMVDSFPAFRDYFKAKARRLGKQQLAWWDLFAPAPSADRSFRWEEARSFILENFAGFSPDLVNLARQAFDNQWIDALQRPGKVGGAYCMPVPAFNQSRILANFDGSLDQVSTLAHELGHAYHNHCIFRAGKSMLQRRTPMTLAETASIMNETIIQHAALEQAASPQEELNILETALIGDSQVIVDIYSRFLFEQEVFKRREKAILSADELCEIMAWSQKETYGDGLDERYLQPYMWTWKPHYYSGELSFYNYPYAFGLLFGVGLYAIYQDSSDRPGFVRDYQELLASTGDDHAAGLAARFGIDIRQKAFWAGSLRVIEDRIRRYVQL